MKIIKADMAGACYGVDRALKIAESALEEGKCACTLGSIIHNPKVVSTLADAGIKAVSDPYEIDTDSVIIRSHGVTPEVLSELRAKNLDIIDATCPHVARAQNAAFDLASRGLHVLVIGIEGHPEVESLVAYAKLGAKEAGYEERVDIVSDKDSIPEILGGTVGIVVQTTQMRSHLDDVLDALDELGIDHILKDTICSATSKRQAAAKDLASISDAVIVIGGRISSNTTKLAQICKELCDATFHIESVEELDDIDFLDFDVVGVTAGASTPEDQIDEVIQRLNELSRAI